MDRTEVIAALDRIALEIYDLEIAGASAEISAPLIAALATAAAAAKITPEEMAETEQLQSFVG